jgi:hypothetical protein
MGIFARAYLNPDDGRSKWGRVPTYAPCKAVWLVIRSSRREAAAKMSRSS